MSLPFRTVLLFVALSIGLAGLIWAETPSLGVGVVVETTPRDYALDKAGVKPGDVLLSWERLPSPPENPESAAGELSSPFDWEWVVIEQSLRGTLKLTGRRQGRRLTWTVPPGFVMAEVRPVLPIAILEPYERGREHLRQKQITEGID